MRTLALGALLLGVLGCGPGETPLDMASTPEASRAALDAGLAGWKAGDGQADLAKRQPPIHFVDPDLIGGSKLVSYEVEPNPRVVGIGYSYAVKLTVTRAGKTRTTRVGFRVVTSPNTAITREDSAS